MATPGAADREFLLGKPRIPDGSAQSARHKWAPLRVLCCERSMRLELGGGKDVLWSGSWDFEVRLDGQPVAPKSEWEEVCRVSDRDVDYLELEIRLSARMRVQRHVLLARQDHFLLLADAVLGERRGRLQYCGSVPLGPGATFQAAAAAREGFLVAGKRRALVLPLALPEWRRDPGGGDLVQAGSRLELRQTAEGRRLFAPLWFDLDRRRMARPATWRQLTVAESMKVQPHDVAVGYRVAIGARQWLIYRSLSAAANRTLLGHNLSTELLVARFDRSGEVTSLIEVE